MTLGERICSLRTQGGLSQADLAERLGVSRQSVSKWETDASVPDLDRLVALASLFEVSLDTLVTGKVPDAPAPAEAPPPAAPADPQPAPLSSRRIAAIVLLALAGMGLLLGSLLAGPVSGLILALPFLVCGLICLFARLHPGLWCGWFLVLSAFSFVELCTCGSIGLVRYTLHPVTDNLFCLVMAWCSLLTLLTLVIVTAVRLRTRPSLPKWVLVGLLVVFVLLWVPTPAFSHWILETEARRNWASLVFTAQRVARVILGGFLLTAVSQWLWRRRDTPSQSA